MRRLHLRCQVLERRLIRIGEEIRMGVTAEVDRIAAAGLPSTDKTGWAQLTAAFPSADQLLDEIQVGDCAQQPCLLPPSWADAACLALTIVRSAAAVLPREAVCLQCRLVHVDYDTVQRISGPSTMSPSRRRSILVLLDDSAQKL